MTRSLSEGSWEDAPYLLNNMEDRKEFLTLLSETIAWCNHLDTSNDSVGKKFRSEELNPFDDQETEILLEYHNIEKAIENLIEYRKNRIREKEIDVPDLEYVRKGTILFFEVDCTVLDHASKEASDGFFDECDCPPWDTWVCYGYEDWYDDKNNVVLVTWVPDECTEKMKSGIYVNPVGCVYTAGYDATYDQEDKINYDSSITDLLETWDIFRNSN